MTDPTMAQQLAIMADICDAADINLDAAAREAAAIRAARIHPEFAVATATHLMWGVMEAVRITFGKEAADRMVAELRAKCAAAFEDNR